MNVLQARQIVKPYPLFRLTFFLVAGIFLSLSMAPEGCPDKMLGCFRGVLAGMGLCLAGCLWKPSFAYRGLFGGLAFGTVALAGALLAQERIRAVRYDWPSVPCAYRATLLERPQEKARTYRCRLLVEARCDSLTCVPVHREVWAYVMKDSLSGRWEVGDGLYFHAQVSPPQPSAFPVAFDYASYLFRKGVSGTAVVRPGCWRRLESRAPLTWRQRALLCRERVLAAYRDWGFRGDELAVLSALTVGYKDDLSEEVQATYRQAGVSHILALSGMHVAVLWGLLAFLLRPLAAFRMGRWVKCLLVIGLLWAFAFLVGLSASVVRAVVMCMWLMVAQAAASESSSLNSLAVAAAGMLCADPFYLFDVGFQLSFLAVFSILLVGPLIQGCWPVRQPVLRYGWGIVSVSLSAQLGTLPLLLYYFSHFPVYFLLANLWVAPLVVLIVYGAVVLWATSPFGWIHAGVVQVLQVLLWLMNAGLRQVEGWPLAGWGSVSLSGPMAAALYLLLACGWLAVVYPSRKWWIPVLLALHAVGAGYCHHAQTRTLGHGLYLAEQRVRAFPEETVWQCDSLYRWRGITVCLAADDRWRRKESSRPLTVDYLYLCRGYRGPIAPLQRLFRIRRVVLDSSLPAVRRRDYETECRSLGIEFVALRPKGSCRILP